jgi:hypothetical protein
MGVLRSSELGEFLCYSPELFPPGGWGPASFGGTGASRVLGGRSNSDATRDSTRIEAATRLVRSGVNYDGIARIAELGGVWCEARDGEGLVLIIPTANSPRGFGSSDGNCLFCFDFDLEISEDGVSDDVAERLQELGVHIGSEVSVR